VTSACRWIAADFGGPEVLRLVGFEVPAPGEGQVRIEVRACGMNPADAKHIAPGQDRSLLPLPIGYEVSGVVSAVGAGVTGLAAGDEVVAPAIGGYTTALTLRAGQVYAKPSALTFAEAANLLLAGTTAADMLHTSGAANGDTVLLHGGAGAVGVSVLQQARVLGVRVIATASMANFGFVERFGAVPVEYGPGLLDRVRGAAPEGVVAALDTVGGQEAGDVSLALVKDRSRVVTIADAPRANADGYVFVGASNSASGPYRASARPRILELAASGSLVVPMAATFGFDEAPAAFTMLTSPHPPGKLALVILCLTTASRRRSS
jgi:NADPH:quinone reductase